MSKLILAALLSLAAADICPLGGCEDGNMLQIHQAKPKASKNATAKAKLAAKAKCARPGKYAIVVVDMQNDFVESTGSLPVSGAEDLIPTINQLVNGLKWDLQVYTEDFHPANHISFAKNSPEDKQPFDFVTLSYAKEDLKICGEDYASIYPEMSAGTCAESDIACTFEQELWPPHCIQNTHGQHFHADLDIPYDALFVRKGTNEIVDSYGAFYNNIGMHIDASQEDIWIQLETALFGAVQQMGIEQLFMVGVAEDYCVKYTALQAAKAGYGVYVVSDATKPVDATTGQEAIEEMKNAGVDLIKSCELLGTCDCA